MSNRLAADSFAQSMAPLIRRLQAKGITTRNAITRELLRRGVHTARNGKWHPTTVARLLARLE